MGQVLHLVIETAGPYRQAIDCYHADAFQRGIVTAPIGHALHALWGLFFSEWYDKVYIGLKNE